MSSYNLGNCEGLFQSSVTLYNQTDAALIISVSLLELNGLSTSLPKMLYMGNLSGQSAWQQ